jgi:hypothetical protein
MMRLVAAVFGAAAFVVAAFVVTAGWALAAPATQSNLGPDGYPRPACAQRPVPPQRPEQFRTEEALGRYNEAVAAYNGAMEPWIDCIQAYVDRAAADIERIKLRMREAIREANE